MTLWSFFIVLFWGLWGVDESFGGICISCLGWNVSPGLSCWNLPVRPSTWTADEIRCSPEEVWGRRQMRTVNLGERRLWRECQRRATDGSRVTCHHLAGRNGSKPVTEKPVRRSQTPSIYWSSQTSSSERVLSLTVAMVMILNRSISFPQAKQAFCARGRLKMPQSKQKCINLQNPPKNWIKTAAHWTFKKQSWGQRKTTHNLCTQWDNAMAKSTLTFASCSRTQLSGTTACVWWALNRPAKSLHSLTSKLLTFSSVVKSSSTSNSCTVAVFTSPS